ncbi:MAG: Sec-dependent nitrous-oxide reductase [Phycisphaeraceae bacterium]|nr:Sec-dependent nitrous-oxide reductase [Phycisphaerales bacterium]MCB9842297.1 Sec-dependent nitrous-oxide reductase [Phycisphaeraceae bacterium]
MTPRKNRLSRMLVPAAAGVALACAGGASAQSMSDVQKAAEARGLTTSDLLAAAKTYTPSGMKDEYLIFSSGGHSGQVFVIGVPSMRLLRTIAVFTPEPWQGWGYGVGNEVLAAGAVNGKQNLWGDTHHPALSETAGDYDGEWLFINDKINARVAVIDLRDFETKQIIKNPLTISDHGGTFVTPDSEYVIEGGQYAVPWGADYAPISEYKEKYRGSVTMWKFDRKKGRIDESKSFAIELPPYWQDLSDAGKLASDGFMFMNSINTEMATGGIEDKKPPFEAGVSKNATDYLHIIDWKKAEKVYQAGKVEKIKGFPVITLATAIEEGLLHLTPEPRSPHGVDVAPKGEFIVVSGKLDPHVTIYSMDKIKKSIAAKKFSGSDDFGVPILDFDSVVEAQVEVGLGPLHTQFGPDGYAYTSLFLDSAVARWTLGGVYGAGTPEPDWTLVHKTPVHYNVGHIGVAEGDTVSPDGKYLVAFNKWSVDRFFQTGPLLPQNFQLLDIAGKGTEMPVIYDMPIGVGEPHYAQIVKADKLKPWAVYPEIGWNPAKQELDPMAPKPKMERVVRSGSQVEVFMTAIRSHFTPEHVTVKQGDRVTWRITNVERAVDATHGFAVPAYNINLSLEPGETATIEFVADTPGTFPFYCSEFCSALHLEMVGYFMVEPAE